MVVGLFYKFDRIESEWRYTEVEVSLSTRVQNFQYNSLIIQFTAIAWTVDCDCGF